MKVIIYWSGPPEPTHVSRSQVWQKNDLSKEFTLVSLMKKNNVVM
jgi:hypothetical protein